jgi:tRNA nucleotidyltransferase (CCA-adding enzyme)
MVIKSRKIRDIVNACALRGGQVLLVGGAVRDSIMGNPRTDTDIEIYGLSEATVQEILSHFGTVIDVGRSFGVFRLTDLDVDFSLPRKDSVGRKPDVIIDPFMSYRDAFMRRDLTMNAMGIDLITQELIDPFNGQDDIKNKVLRTPNPELFIQDPLRFFRVMQFVGRFGMNPDNELNAVCASMDLIAVSREWIVLEIEKLFLKSVRPSLGLRWLKKINRLHDVFPELYATIGIAQRADFHPEGDVFEHTMQALDAAASYEYESDQQKLVVLFAALCHDLGKVTTTILVDGIHKSPGHAQAGIVPARQLMRRMSLKNAIFDAVPKLVKYHMEPLMFIKGGAKASAYKRLALKLAPELSMMQLALLSRADKQGRNRESELPLTNIIPEVDQFIAKLHQYNIMHRPEEAVLQGRDILHLNVTGPEMGRLLKKAYEVQIEEGILDKNDLLQLIYFKKGDKDE